MKAITEKEFIQMVKETKGATFVSFTSWTEAQKSKAKNAVKVNKLSRVNGVLNYVYEKAVNRQLNREGKEASFESKGLPAWKGVLSPSLTFHKAKGTVYLRVKIERSLQKPRFFVNGKEVEKEKVSHLLPAPSSAPNQGTEKEVIHREYKIESIDLVTMNGEDFRILH